MAYKKAIRNAGRLAYKSTGYKNPMKKGRLMTSRIVKQLPKLLTDVSRLKGIINSEKFRIETQPADGQPIGQVSQNTSGHWIYDFTPIPTQGDTVSSRQGSSIRWKSSHYSFFFQRQSASVGPCNIRIQLVKVIGEPYPTISSVLQRYIEVDKWISGASIYDNASDRKSDYFKLFRVLRTVNVKFPALQYTGTAGQVQKIVNFGLKLPSHHVKFNANTNTLADGQVFCLITMDTGNCAGTASTLDSIANTQASTGVLMSCNKIDYYYDN